MSIFQPLPNEDGCSYLRLLRLRPGDSNDPIECTLEVVTHEESEDQYEAISYCWGDAEDTVPIVCNGLHVSITRSLESALRRFRTPSGSTARLLWADAICINQKDDQEKGSQVGRMGEVYANARRVLVWLGCEVDGATATSIFSMISETVQYLDEVYVQCDEDILQMPELTEPYPICLEQSKWLELAALFDISWFYRVWTLQEVALAKECGMFWSNAETNAADIFELCNWCLRKPDLYDIISGLTERTHIGSIVSNFNVYMHYKPHESERRGWLDDRPLSARLVKYETKRLWIDLLADANHLEATDPRDYIYAFLGCPAAISIANHSLLQADYTMSKDELYTRVARTLLQDPVEGPWLLCATDCQSRESLIRGVTPSWVPIWDTRSETYDIARQSFWYRAGGPDCHFNTGIQDTGLLVVHGSIFDKVTWMSEGLVTKDFFAANAEPYIDTLWDQVDAQVTGLGMSLQRQDFLMSLLQGFQSSKSCEEAWQQRQLNAYLKKACSKLATARSDHLTQIEESDAASIARRFRVTGYSIVVTLGGRIGLARTISTRIDDTLCIFHGVSVPFVLAQTSQGRFKIAAQAYIHGVMSGELIDQFEAQDIILK